MNRPAGITATAVLLVMGGLACLGMAAVMYVALFLAGDVSGSPVAQLPLVFRYSPIAIFGGIGGWALATAVGVWKLRPWGRTSLIVFSALLVLMQGMGAIMMLFLPFPETDPRVTKLMGIVRVVVVAFYLVQVAVGIGWLIYFNRPATKALFAGSAQPNDKPGRPLSIAVIAWHLVAGGLFCLLTIWLGWPTMLLGVVMKGWAAVAAYMVMGTVSAFLGIALLKLHPRAVDWTMGYICFFVLHSAFFWLTGNTEQTIREMIRELPLAGLPEGQSLPMMPPWVSLLLGVLTLGVPLWYLATRRAAYLAASRASVAPPKPAS